jgi:hypothetical protein
MLPIMRTSSTRLDRVRPFSDRGVVSCGQTRLRARLADTAIYDTCEAGLEAFGDEFEQLAKTTELKGLASAFQQFVGELTSAGLKAT